ncbi:endonuclease/exonuclease/phosphatase family protein [Jannaschia sp. KMU-145]|uniref:endonuclease/exonuclease/phosphatase family protein n=1 Tax=Jannaschia halovivens TaxID=3388667 RepID=UPI00396B2E0D
MQIMSLNAWGGACHDALVPYLAETAPHILCLQEVVHTPDAPAPWLTYRDGAHVLPQRADILSDVARALPDHVAIFCPAAQGVLWHGEAAVPSRWGLATFVHRRLPIVAQAQGFVHKGYEPDGYGDHPRSRSAHAVRVWDHDAGQGVCVTQMHGLRDPSVGKADTAARAIQADRLVALSDRAAEAGDRVVICGDFNVEPESETLARLTRAGLTELVTAGGFDGTRTSLYSKPGRFADYMCVDDPNAVLAFEVVRSPEVSDHCALLLTI